MAANTGRTTSKWVDFRVDDSSGTLRSIPINSLSACGVVYDEQDLTGWQDSVRGVLPSMPDAPISISGPLDTAVAAAAGTLSGSHTVLSNLPGLTTPLSLGAFIGMRQTWVSGEPVFGITSTSANGYICTSYQVDLSTMTYTANFKLYPGSALPAWGTTAIT